MKKRLINAAPFLVAGLMLLSTLCIYAAGYLWLGEYKELIDRSSGKVLVVMRSYRHEGAEHFYRPASYVEYRLRATPVMVCRTGDPDPFD